MLSEKVMQLCTSIKSKITSNNTKSPDNRRENWRINLVSYGDPKGYSAIAKTVGFPCAFPTDIYRPMNERLKSEGIVVKETSHFIET